MTLQPYHTALSVLKTAEDMGHVVLNENKVITIDTGEDLIFMDTDGIKDREGKTITAEQAAAIIAKAPEA